MQPVWHRQYGGVEAFPQALVCHGCRTARVYKRLTASSCIPGPEPQVLARALAALSPWLSGRAGVGGKLEWGDGALLHAVTEHLSPLVFSLQCQANVNSHFLPGTLGVSEGERWTSCEVRQRHIILVLKFSHPKLRERKKGSIIDTHEPWEKGWNVKHMLYGSSSSHFW